MVCSYFGCYSAIPHSSFALTFLSSYSFSFALFSQFVLLILFVFRIERCDLWLCLPILLHPQFLASFWLCLVLDWFGFVIFIFILVRFHLLSFWFCVVFINIFILFVYGFITIFDPLDFQYTLFCHH